MMIEIDKHINDGLKAQTSFGEFLKNHMDTTNIW